MSKTLIVLCILLAYGLSGPGLLAWGFAGAANHTSQIPAKVAGKSPSLLATSMCAVAATLCGWEEPTQDMPLPVHGIALASAMFVGGAVALALACGDALRYFISACMWAWSRRHCHSPGMCLGVSVLIGTGIGVSIQILATEVVAFPAWLLPGVLAGVLGAQWKVFGKKRPAEDEEQTGRERKEERGARSRQPGQSEQAAGSGRD